MSKDWKPKWAELTATTHTEQAIWWLNGFWADGFDKKAEEIWVICHKFIECQLGHPVLHGSKKQDIKEDCDLDELKSHIVLEKLGETLTVVALRKRLKDIDIDNNKRMAVSEYLLDKYKKTPAALIFSPQGEIDPKELADAEQKCEAAAAAAEQAAVDAEAARKALQVSIEKKAFADKEHAAAQAAEAEVRKAEAELQAVVDEITALEKAKADKIAQAQAIIDDPKTSVVKRGQAVQTRDQTLAEDPLPLRKAKITQTAALKRVEKARIAAENATKAAEEAARQAHDAQGAAEAAKQKADDAKIAADDALAAAQAALEELKAKGGSPLGKIWWMERILAEKKKYAGRGAA